MSRGQALVELALVAPVMLLLLGGAVDLGRLFYSEVTISDASREGALWAAQHPGSWMQGCDADPTKPISATNPNQVVCHTRNEASGGFVTIASADVTCSKTPAPTVTPCDAAGPAEGEAVYVTVRGVFTTIMGGITFHLETTTAGRIVKVPPMTTQTGQTITFGPLPDREVGSGSFTVSATASSGLPVSFTTSTPTTCGYGGPDGSTISILAVGTCTVIADQAGDAHWAAASPVTRSFQITPPPPPPPAGQTITFDPLPDRQLGSGSFAVTATASSGLTVTFTTTTPSVCASAGPNGSTITLTQVGTCTVKADQAGNASFTPAPSVLQTFNITPAPPPVCNAPVVRFTANPTTGTAFKNKGRPGTLFTFNAGATTLNQACNPVWSWNFGNAAGTSSTPWQTTYTYPAPAPLPLRHFTVTLLVTLDGGQSGSASQVVTVNPG
jgi:Flp pilus assembly protein TadG